MQVWTRSEGFLGLNVIDQTERPERKKGSDIIRDWKVIPQFIAGLLQGNGQLSSVINYHKLS